MFSKSSSKPTGGRERRSTPSILGADCQITGDIVSDGEVQVDGRIKGDIHCNVLVVGATGIITGEITAQTVRVYGTINGQIRASAVELAKTAHVVGDIAHESLSVEAGAFVEGRFDRLPDGAQSGGQKLPPPALPERNHGGAQPLLNKPEPESAAS